MTLFAGHCPTKEFTHAEWSAMPVHVPDGQGYPPPVGFSRSTDSRGKPIVIWFDLEHWRGNYCVRPLVRVPMRKVTA